MISRISIAALVSACLIGAIYFFVPQSFILQAYPTALRTGLAGIFAAVTIYFLNFKQQFLVQLKSTILDTPAYKKMFARARQVDGTLDIHKPFANLSTLIGFCFYSSAITTVAQFTFGLHIKLWSVFLCLYMVFFTGILVLLVNLIKTKILRDWQRISDRFPTE